MYDHAFKWESQEDLLDKRHDSHLILQMLSKNVTLEYVNVKKNVDLFSPLYKGKRI